MEKTGCLNGPALPQLRREARLRREYLYRKAREEAERTAQERKDKVRRALEGTCVPRCPIFSRDLSFKTQRETGPSAVKGFFFFFFFQSSITFLFQVQLQVHTTMNFF